jgi:hypothetical protein
MPMSDSSAYGFVELVFAFGVVLAVLIWQLIVTRRSLREDRERAARDKAKALPDSSDRAEDN